MTPDDPRHGTNAGYHAHIKSGDSPCNSCREARRTYNRRTNKNRRRGWSGLVPVDRARQHILALRTTGMTWDQIGDAAGVARSTVFRTAGLDRPTDRIRSSTAAKILAVRDMEPDPARVPLFRARRRLQALQCLGWSLAEIGERCGWSSQNLLAIIRDNTWRPRETVSAATFAKIARVYDELSMRVAPNDRYTSNVRNRARRLGYMPPLAWDDIDDPNEQPRGVHRTGEDRTRTKDDVDPVVVERVLAGDKLPTTKAEKFEITRRWTADGRSLNELERLTGWKSDRYVVREQEAS